jgi:microcystin-dependent protein
VGSASDRVEPGFPLMASPATTAAPDYADPDADGLVGEPHAWLSDTLPANGKYRFCDGSAVSRTEFSLLFARIGTVGGVGDGSTTFNLPNLQDRFLVGAGSDADWNDIGDTGGSKTGAVTASGFSSFDGGDVTNAENTAGNQVLLGAGVGAAASPHTHNQPTHQHSTTVTGTAVTVPPFFAVRWILKVRLRGCLSADLLSEWR